MSFSPSYSTVDPRTRDRREKSTREEEPRQESGGGGVRFQPAGPENWRQCRRRDLILLRRFSRWLRRTRPLTALALALRSTLKSREGGDQGFLKLSIIVIVWERMLGAARCNRHARRCKGDPGRSGRRTRTSRALALLTGRPLVPAGRRASLREGLRRDAGRAVSPTE